MAIDSKTIEIWYRKYGPMVFRRCHRLLRNEEKSLEAMQEVFIKVLRSKDDLTNNSPSSFLYTVATNTCLNMIRSSKRKPEIPSSDIIDQIAFQTTLESKIESSNFLRKIFNGHVSLAHIAILYYVDELTLEQVATEANLSVSGVRKRLNKLKIVAKSMEVEHG